MVFSFCHSLPTDGQIANFDFTIFDRPLSGPDYQRAHRAGVSIDLGPKHESGNGRRVC